MTFRYLTPDRMQWHRWTRKRRLKFRKRWRKQHDGQKFSWMISEFHYATIPFVEKKWVILHQRERPEVGPPLDVIKPSGSEVAHVILHRRGDTEKFSPFLKP